MSEGFEEKQAANVEQAMEADTTDPMTGTAEDQSDMTRIGKKQELLVSLLAPSRQTDARLNDSAQFPIPVRAGLYHRHHCLVGDGAIVSLWRRAWWLAYRSGTVNVPSSTISYGLVNGGLAGLVWMFIVAAVGMGTVVLSLAEMASMFLPISVINVSKCTDRPRAPTSGGQYHWVSEFAPPGVQKFLSFLTGLFPIDEVTLSIQCTKVPSRMARYSSLADRYRQWVVSDS